jgi:mannose-6-phosphate isomerase
MNPYLEHRDKPWGFEQIYAEPGLPYAGKILNVLAGRKLSLQYHDVKEETIMLLNGAALIWLGPDQEHIEKIPMLAGKGYTIKPFVVHRIEALEDSRLLEVSTPEAGTTVRLQDDYARPDEKR